MILWITALALAGKWDGMEADIVAEVAVNAAMPVIREQFEDLHTLDLYSDACASERMIGEPSAHVGAPFRVRYDAGPWSRLAEGTISEVGHQYVDWEHTGRYGFTTRYQFTEDPETSETVVTMTTFLDTPPWPFRGIFFKRVRPGWAACHHELLTAVADKLNGQFPEPMAQELPMDEAVPRGVMERPLDVEESESAEEPESAEESDPAEGVEPEAEDAGSMQRPE